jgi:hypothetical protein
MIQGGDIDKGDGTGVASIYGGEYEDENLGWRDIDAAGLLCSANRGKDTNGSQYARFSLCDLRHCRSMLIGQPQVFHHYRQLLPPEAQAHYLRKDGVRSRYA